MRRKEDSNVSVHTTRLLDEMRNGIYASVSMLPPETEIAERFSVSRTMIRDCLAILDREGFISRKRGLGTIINRHVLNVRTRIDLEKEFSEIIKDEGYEPKASVLDYWLFYPDDRLSERLMINPGDEALAIERVIWAGDEPAIYCIDYVPGHLFKKESLDPELVKRPVFDFLAEACDEYVYMDLTEISAINATGKAAKELQLPDGTPVLKLDERGFSFSGHVVLFAEEYYRQGRITHTLLRKKI